MEIREFTTDDYTAIAYIHNAIYPNKSTTPEAWAENDKQRNPKCKMKRWVALQDGQIVGFAGYSQSVFDYQPGKFFVALRVHPDWQRCGTGSALYDQVMAALRHLNPTTLRADGYGNLPEGVRFLEKRGFIEVFRERPLHLDAGSFDPHPYAGLVEKLRDEGIEIKMLRELEADPDRNRKVYDVFWEAFEDVPKENPITPMDFGEWVEWTIDDPLVKHDGYILAVHGQVYIGLCEFCCYREHDDLQAGLVGVKRAYRGRGVAFAMHLRAIAFAKANGHPVIRTSTSVTNRPMLGLYTRLGFAAQPDWLQLEKRLETG